MDKFELQCNEWVRSGNWLDFYKIFQTRSHLSYDYVNDHCRELGREYPSWLTKTTKKILYHLVEIAEDYEINMLSTIDISEKYGIPRTTLQGVLSPLGILRSKSEAMAVALSLGRMEPPCGSIIYYKYNESHLTLKSSYELAYLQQLEHQGLHWEYESEIIPYLDSDGLEHHYIPDFKIIYDDHVEIHEVKPLEFIDTECNQLKFEAARAYCESKNFKFRVITEEDIDWDLYPNMDDVNIISDPDEGRESLPTDHFVTKIRTGTYTYKNHPRTLEDISYDSIMEFINSYPKYTVSIYDVYEIISRNGIITRLRDEAPDDEKDIRRWMCKYLADEAMTNTEFDLIKLEYQRNGIRDFGLLDTDQLINKLKDLHRKIAISDFFDVTGYSRNKLLRYCFDVLKVNPYEIIEEINSKIEEEDSSI